MPLGAASGASIPGPPWRTWQPPALRPLRWTLGDINGAGAVKRAVIRKPYTPKEGGKQQ